MTKIYVIAEMAYSHDGKCALAEKIVHDAADAGADAISIHITHMPDYMVRDYGAGPGRVSAGKETRPIYDYLVDITLPFEDWSAVAEVARKRKLDLVVMPNDGPSLDFAKRLAPAALVVPPACFEEHDFVSAIGKTALPVYARVGGATLGDIESVVNILRVAGSTDITLLYGHQSYPTGVAETNLLFLSCLKDTFGLPVGIADHLDADDPFATILPLLAVPLGITCIEKHLTHDRSKRGEDFESALNGPELKTMIERLRKTEQALGSRHAGPLDEASMRYRKNVRKRLVAARDIKAGERIGADMLIAKRADIGASPAEKERFINMTALADIAEDDGIDWSLVGQKTS